MRPEVVEGEWSGDLIAIAFPDLTRAWYAWAAYQRIQPLPTRHSHGAVILLDGVDESHKATDILRA